MSNHPQDWSQLSFFPEVGNALSVFMHSIQGTYVVRLPGLVRRGEAWVECEAVIHRGTDGATRYDTHPIPYARTIPAAEMSVAETKPPGAQRDPKVRVFTGGQFSRYKEDDVASTLQTRGNRTGSMDLIVTGEPDSEEEIETNATGDDGPPARQPAGGKRQRSGAASKSR
jgi:hypothetical protein